MKKINPDKVAELHLELLRSHPKLNKEQFSLVFQLLEHWYDSYYGKETPHA